MARSSSPLLFCRVKRSRPKEPRLASTSSERACYASNIPRRIAWNPLVPYSGRCGGCQYQHAAYESQLRFKRDILVETLRRVGKIEFDPARIAIESAEPLGYRNRAQFHFERGRIGYREMNSRRLVAIDQCLIGSPKINEIVAQLAPAGARSPMARDLCARSKSSPMSARCSGTCSKANSPWQRRFFEWIAEEVPGDGHRSARICGERRPLPGERDFIFSGEQVSAASPCRARDCGSQQAL